MTKLRSRFNEVTYPFFALQGTEDKVCDPVGAQMIYDDAASVKKQLKVRTSTGDQFHYDRIIISCLSDVVALVLTRWRHSHDRTGDVINQCGINEAIFLWIAVSHFSK